MTTIEILRAALAPLLAQSITTARPVTERKLSEIRKRFEACDWDAGRAFPYPRPTLSRIEFAEAKALHDFAWSVTRSDPAHRRIFTFDPDIRLWDAGAADRALALAERAVRKEFEAFVAKLADKLGEGVAGAECRCPAPDGLWAYSELVVKRASGAAEFWRTQVVANSGKYGRPFLQWPIRRIK